MKLFGTDGIRGKYDKVNESLAFAVGRSVGQSMGMRNAYVGRDTRASSEALASAISVGMVQSGMCVYNVGIVPTPAVSMLCNMDKSAIGIMITASHNPPEYNGIKIFGAGGYKLDRAAERLISSNIDNRCTCATGKLRTMDGYSRYVTKIIKSFTGEISGVKVKLDCAHGATYRAAREIFVALGAEVCVVNDTPRPDLINVNCGAIHPSAISDCDLGFAFDGDGDRVIVGAQGLMDGDSVLWNLASHRKGDVVGTVMSNTALKSKLAEHGRKLFRTSVGDRNVSQAMRTRGIRLGGEPSGHYIINPSVSGDGIYAALKISDIYVRHGLERLDLLPQVARDYALSKDKQISVQAVANIATAHAGVRSVIRRSGTEPKLRVMLEGKDENVLEQILDEITAYMEGV